MGDSGIDLSGSEREQVAVSFEGSNEPPGFMKCGKFNEWLKNYLFLKN
jgi:hypothetical protein